MKAKIGTKIMLSYLFLLMVIFITTVILVNGVLERSLKRYYQKELGIQADAIVQLLEKDTALLQGRREQVFKQANLLNMDHMTNANVFVVDQRGNVIYDTNNSNKKITFNRLKEKFSKDEYLYAVKPIKSSSSKLYGRVVLITNMRSIKAIQVLVRNILVVILLTVTLLAAVLAFVMQRNIVKPIKQLKKGIEQTSLDNDAALQPISTGDEIETLYHAYDKLLQSLKKSVTDKKHFFQNASHELKSPLMSIQGYAEAIKDGVVEGEEIDESLDIIISKTKKLKRVVEDIIYLSKLENLDMPYTFEKVSIDEFLLNCVSDYEQMCKQQGIQIVLENQLTKEVILSLDLEKFEDAMGNLLTNALRYAKSIIKVQVLEGDKNISIKVMDDGKGFDPQEVKEDKIFERFYKGNDGVSGLGLAIVKAVVEEHKGTIRAYNQLNGGAVIEIRLKNI